MKIPTSYLRMTAMAVLAAGLIGCGGGGSGGGGPDIPTASNAPITPPPTASVAIAAGAGAATKNQTIAAAAFQALDGAAIGGGNSITPFGVEIKPAVTETMRLTVVEIVRRHVEKIKNHKLSASVTGAQIVETVPCFVSGTLTLVVDDVSGSFSEILVHCDDGGGAIFHGSFSSTLLSFSSTLGSTVGSPYSMSVAAAITIDLSVTTTGPAAVLISQGSFSFSESSSGTMVSDGAGGVTTGFPTHVETRIFGTSLLGSDGVNSELLSIFDLTTVDDDVTGTTKNGHFTYASSAGAINGAVTVNITTPIHYASGALHPNAGVLEITTTASPGKIKVTFSSGATPVKVEVFANAANPVPDDTYTLTWAQFEALI